MVVGTLVHLYFLRRKKKGAITFHLFLYRGKLQSNGTNYSETEGYFSMFLFFFLHLMYPFIYIIEVGFSGALFFLFLVEIM